MIQEFSIENTFSIKTRQTISFEATDDTDDLHCINVGRKKLLKLAAIYGANASGKTNVIKAFNFYMDFILNSFTSLKPNDPIRFTPFLFDEESAKSSGTFEIIFFIDETEYKYRLRLASSTIVSEELRYITEKKEGQMYRRWTDGQFYHWEGLTQEMMPIQSMTRVNATFLSTAAQFNDQPLGKIYSYLADIMLPTIWPTTERFSDTAEIVEKNESLKKIVLSMLKKADFSNINDIIVERDEIKDLTFGGIHLAPTGTRTRVSFSHHYDKDVPLPLSAESRGTQRFFTLIGPLLQLFYGNQFLCIDEIEASLHDDLLESFIKTFLDNCANSQLLFTTHNQDLLDSDLLKNDEIWFVEKGETGGSELFSLIEFEDVPEGVSRRGLYKAGAFGAKPFIYRYFKD